MVTPTLKPKNQIGGFGKKKISEEFVLFCTYKIRREINI